MNKIIYVLALMACSFSVHSSMTFQVVDNGNVSGYFQGGTAEYSSLMNAKFSDGSIDNPYMSNHSAIGTRFDHGYHQAGSQVVFDIHVLDISQWFFSMNRFNDDGINHIHAHNIFLPDGTKAVYVGFEDILGGGDLDFDDSTAIFTNVQISPVPEPETYAMMIMGLLIVCAWKFRARSTIW